MILIKTMFKLLNKLRDSSNHLLASQYTFLNLILSFSIKINVKNTGYNMLLILMYWVKTLTLLKISVREIRISSKLCELTYVYSHICSTVSLIWNLGWTYSRNNRRKMDGKNHRAVINTRLKQKKSTCMVDDTEQIQPKMLHKIDRNRITG